ncbi:MAG: hypothetical protein NTW30_05825 [Candidatus Aenigmarchaeota archaeon]|nr:hypothetical protein [Candidatus Aenigmarchaeota archaeon]
MEKSSKKSKKEHVQIPQQLQNFIRTHIRRNKESPQVIAIINKIIHNGTRPNRVRKLCDGIADENCRLALRSISKIRRDHGPEAAKKLVQGIIPGL